MAVAVLTPVPHTSGAGEPDPEKTKQQRDEVRSQRAEVDLQVDTLVAKDAEVTGALAELETNAATQEAELGEAERAHEEAEADLQQATQAVADAHARIEDLDREADEMVVEAFVNPPSDNALDAFKAESLSDAAVKQALIEIQADTDADVLDQLDEAHEDLEVEEANKAEAVAAAAGKEKAAAQELSDLEAALAQQQAFAGEVEERLNAKLAEAESLKEFDTALSDRLVREQAEVAARLRAMQEAAERQRVAQHGAPDRAAPAALRLVQLRDLLHAVVAVQSPDGAPGFVDARAGAGDRLQLQRRRRHPLRQRVLELVGGARQRVRPVQPAERALALVDDRPIGRA